MSLTRKTILSVAVVLAAITVVRADDDADARAQYIRSHYTKFEHRIPMRDGVRLFTAVYVPNTPGGGPYPILLLRTPYGVGPYGVEKYRRSLGPGEGFDRDGFIFVYQDVRGRYMSEGQFVNMRPHLARKASKADVDESTDTWDTIDWLLAHVDGHNGKVGMWGISYPGFYCSAGMIDSHPALAAVSPQAPIADWFWDDMHRNGAFILPLTFNFFATFGKARPEPTTERHERFDHGTPDGYRFFLDLGPLKNVDRLHFKGEIGFWNEIVAHPNYDAFWQARNILPHLENVKAAVLTVGGWFDTEDLYGALQTYRAVERQNPDTFNALVMGPWSHGGWNRTEGDALGGADFGFKTSEFYREHVERAFFEHFLEGGEPPDLPEALMFETGANRWRSFDSWPPGNLRRAELYLREDGRLSFEPPEAEDGAHDAYVSDPAKPVPYTMEITARWARDYMTEDQRFAAWRPDVLVYRSEALADDLTLAGPMEAELWVATTGSASDWIVKIIDEYPATTIDRERDDDGHDGEDEDLGGTQRLVRADVIRGRFRNGFEHPEPFVPNEITRVRFTMQDILHTFKRGHRVMVQIQSTWFPLVDRNPQRYVPNIFEAEEDDFIAVTNRVYRSTKHPSRVRVRVLE